MATVVATVLVMTAIILPDGPIAIDQRVLTLAEGWNAPWLRRMMLGFTGLGNTLTVVWFLAGILAITVSRRDWVAARFLVLPPLLGALITTTAKVIVARPRPGVGALVESSHSWPSGHATAGLAMALGAVLFWRARHRQWVLRAAVVVPIGLMVGVSRALLGIHWATDVASGWLVALLAAAITVGLTRDWSASVQPQARQVGSFDRARVVAAAMAVGLVLTVVVSSNRALPQLTDEPVADVSAVQGAHVGSVHGRLGQ